MGQAEGIRIRADVQDAVGAHFDGVGRGARRREAPFDRDRA